MSDRTPGPLGAAVAAACGVTAVALLGSSPGLAALDAGDLVTAAAELGVAHPTGFPLYTLLAHAASSIPLGDIAGRVASTSAICSGIAAGLAVWLFAAVLRLREGAWVIAIAIALVFSTADTLVMHARVPEVYALNLALLLGALVSLERLGSTGDARWCLSVALACGFGLGNHALFGLWTPILVGSVIALAPRRTRGRALGASLVLGLSAMLVYAYLPAAAARPPAHNWGDPSNLERWWAHVSAASIRGAYRDEMNPGFYGALLWLKMLGRQLWAGAGGLVALSAIGAGFLAIRGRYVGLALLACVALEVWYAIAINPMGIRDFQNGQLVAVFAAAAGAGALALAAERVGRAGVLAGSGLVLLSAALCGPSSFGDLGRDRAIEDLALAHLALAAPDSVSLPVGDSLTAALLYADVVLDGRPDMAVLGRNIVSNGEAAARLLVRQPFAVVPAERLDAWRHEGNGHLMARMAEILAHAAERRLVYWEPTGRGDELPAGWKLVHRWPLGEVVRADTVVDECVPPELSLCGPAGDAPYAGEGRGAAGRSAYAYRRWLARQWGYRGARAFAAHRFAETGMFFERARALMPDNPAWTTGVAVSLANTGEMEEALAVQLDALAMNPMSTQAVRNAIIFAGALGRSDEVARLRRHARRLDLLGGDADPPQHAPRRDAGRSPATGI